MKKVMELREKQQEIVVKAREVLDQITDETTEARAVELEAEYDGFMSEYDSLEDQAKRQERLDTAERSLQEGDNRKPVGEDRTSKDEEQESKLEYRDVFESMLRFGAGSLDEEARSMLSENRFDVESRAQSTTTTTAGGYTVPAEFSGEIDKAMALWGPMWDASIVRELVTSNGRTLPWPTVDDTSKTGELHTQNSAATDDGGADVVFGQKQLDAYLYDTEVVRIPLELLEDSAFNMEQLMTDLFAERLGRLANTALTTGTGSSQPNGIVTASSLGATSTSATAITADELIDLVHSVDPAYRGSPKCRFQFNDSTLAAIRKLKDGQGNYLWQVGDVRTGEPNRLLGHPYSVNQAMDSIAAEKKVVLFGDHSRYLVRKVRDFAVLTLRERYAEYFQIGMIGFKRFDGELLNTAAVKHLITHAA